MKIIIDIRTGHQTIRYTFPSDISLADALATIVAVHADVQDVTILQAGPQ